MQIEGKPTTKSVRENFAAAHAEISALQTQVAQLHDRIKQIEAEIAASKPEPE
jgi:hypothetical protein